MRTFRVIKTNQYAKRRKNLRGALATAGITTAMILVMGARITDNRFITAHIDSYDIHPVMAADIEPTETPTPTAIPKPLKENIKDYIKEIFGRDAKIACAVARAESGFNHGAENVSGVENSRGIFQINIKSEKAKVHYDRIPGESVEEKIEWLEDPYNNTLLAYWIFDKSGWNPWSAYTNGAYKQFLTECN